MRQTSWCHQGWATGVCDRAPDFLSPSEDQVLRPALGSSVALNCTAWVVSGPHCSLPS
ncbi:SIGIRR isoform 7, partial [Pan troglodytes]